VNQQGGQIVNEDGKGLNTITNENTVDTAQVSDDHDGCFRIVRTSKSVQIPCTRNVTRRYKVSVPKTVQEKIPRRVEYTDYETRERQEPYTVKRCETAYREADEPYTVQVPQKVIRMVKVTKKVPKTVYVDVVTDEPQESTIMVPETRTRKIKVPYQKEIIDQKYRSVTEQVPVTKYRTEYDTVSKTVYEDRWRTKVVPVTKIISKEIPVYNVVPTGNCGNCGQVDTTAGVKNSVENLIVHSNRESNIEVQRPQPSPHQYRNTNRNPGQAITASPHPNGVIQNPEAVPVTSSAPVMSNGANNQVNYPTRTQSMSYPNDAQVGNQREPAPIMNDVQPQYVAPPQYTNINDAKR